MNRHLRAALDRGLVSDQPKSAAAPTGAVRPFRLPRGNFTAFRTAQVVAPDLSKARALIAETDATLAAAARPRSAPLMLRSIGPRGDAMRAAAAAPKAAPAPAAPKLSCRERSLLAQERAGTLAGLDRTELALARKAGRVPQSQN